MRLHGCIPSCPHAVSVHPALLHFPAVVEKHRLANGLLFGLPVVLDTDSEDIVVGDRVLLTYQGQVGGPPVACVVCVSWGWWFGGQGCLAWSGVAVGLPVMSVSSSRRLACHGWDARQPLFRLVSPPRAQSTRATNLLYTHHQPQPTQANKALTTDSANHLTHVPTTLPPTHPAHRTWPCSASRASGAPTSRWRPKTATAQHPSSTRQCR